LTGLLFLQRISDNRMTGTSLRNTRMFEQICGTDALQNVVLVTTMWDEVSEHAGSKREDDLRANFWDSMVTCGARMARFGDTYQSAWEIVDQLIGFRRPLQIQTEMVDEGKPLARTAAGSALFRWLRESIAKFRARILALIRAVPKNSDAELANRVLCEKLAVQKNLDMASKQINLLAGQPANQPRRSLADVVRRMMALKASSSPSEYMSASSTSLPNVGAPQSHPGPITTSSVSSPIAHHRSQSSTSLPNTSLQSPPGCPLDDHHIEYSCFEKRDRKRVVAAAVLKHAKDAAEIAPVPFLKGILSLTVRIADSIEVCPLIFMEHLNSTIPAGHE